MSRFNLKVDSNKPMPGVYVGDPCYILNDEFYQKFWGKENNFEDGAFSKDGRPVMIVCSTAYGDGCYDGQIHDYENHSNTQHDFPVDAGVLAVVNLEFADPDELERVKERELGIILDKPCTMISLDEYDGEFNFFIGTEEDNFYNVEIDTAGEYEEEEEEEEPWEEEEQWGENYEEGEF